MKTSGSAGNIFLMITLVAAMLMTSCGGGLKVSVPDEYNYDDLSEYITLGEYKGVRYEVADVQVSQDEIQEYINNVLADAGETQDVKEGTVEADDVVNIDYTGKLNGVEFDGGSAEGYELDLANSNFIEGFAEGIVGHRIGETFDLPLKFPDNYGNADLAGQNTVFTITVNSVKESVLPEYNDDFVKANTDYDNTEDYEASIKEELEAEKKYEAAEDERLDVFNQILDASEVIKYPEKEYNAKYNSIVDTYKNYADDNDIDLEEYLQEQMGWSLDEFTNQAEAVAKDQIKQELVLYAIAAAEDISITDKEYSQYLEKLLNDAGYTPEQFKEGTGLSISEYAEQNGLFYGMLYQTVMDKVMEYSVEA